MKRIINIFVCSSMLFGCNKVVEEPLGKEVFSKQFISSFIDANTISMVQCPIEGNAFLIEASPEDDLPRYKYLTLCHEVGDISYDRMVPQDKNYTACYANKFTSIDITSTADFGAIKAGESLADIVMFRGATAKPYIDNGYEFPDANEYHTAYKEIKKEFGDLHWYFLKEFRNGFYPICKRVSELTPEQLKLLSCNCMSIRFMEVPEIKEHTMTITFHTENKEVECQFDVVFP